MSRVSNILCLALTCLVTLCLLPSQAESDDKTFWVGASEAVKDGVTDTQFWAIAKSLDKICTESTPMKTTCDADYAVQVSLPNFCGGKIFGFKSCDTNIISQELWDVEAKKVVGTCVDALYDVVDTECGGRSIQSWERCGVHDGVC
ncbi:uncharacterized protein BCR38DRAFT_506689 [Pseudomassariella vexata]|uniref:Uncharacterized protein n=1 Tax=Pseudomassariella vexata TaxID=1141098 RepID=A0A1Y2E9K9_9PEZI|nr:uncharacterized protein BCR38DRAFT_506689 [Pseudomassariella vexata]ORY68260.1 hypothetical protein BCR38DRAFT_506689 [Pseudomassariella vexata]